MAAYWFHSQRCDTFLHQSRQNLLFEAHEICVKRIDRHLNRVERELRIQHGKMNVWIFVPCEPDEPNLALLLRLHQRLSRATRSYEQLGIVVEADAMDLPQIQVIGLQPPQA